MARRSTQRCATRWTRVDERWSCSARTSASSAASAGSRDGLLADFGERRWLRPLPLAEAGIVGFALGMAMSGLRPVVEMQVGRVRVPGLRTDRVARRQAAQPDPRRAVRTDRDPGAVRRRHRWGRALTATPARPTTRTPRASRWLAPATVDDAYSLLRKAIADPDRWCSWNRRSSTSRPATRGCRCAPNRSVGPWCVGRAGRDAADLRTVGAGGAGRGEAAVEENWDLEVIDLRTLVPFDDETVTASVRRTGRCVIIHEAAGFGGVGAEIAARCRNGASTRSPPRCCVEWLGYSLSTTEAGAPPPARCGPHPRRGGPPAVGRPARPPVADRARRRRGGLVTDHVLFSTQEAG